MSPMRTIDTDPDVHPPKPARCDECHHKTPELVLSACCRLVDEHGRVVWGEGWHCADRESCTERRCNAW